MVKAMNAVAESRVEFLARGREVGSGAWASLLKESDAALDGGKAVRLSDCTLTAATAGVYSASRIIGRSGHYGVRRDKAGAIWLVAGKNRPGRNGK